MAGIPSIHILLILVLIATCVAIAVKWIKLPYSIALVLVGLAIGIYHMLPPVTMTPDLILLVFLPSMLFEASWNLDLQMLKRCWKPVVALATVGVVLSTIVVGTVVHRLAGIDFAIALLFGAMISATDPISVLALLKRMGIEKRLVTILEGESLLNDATAVVLFRILLAAVIAGGPLSIADIGSQFFIVTAGGIIVGLLVGAAASWLTRFFDDHLLEITLTIVAAYGSYVLAEQIHTSSVMAVLVAGVLMGNFGSRNWMSPTTRLAVDSFWEYAAFIAESLVFLLIGLQIKLDLLVKHAPFIGIAILAILVGRLAVIYGLAPFVSTKEEPISKSWRHLLFWGGLRGSLCMAMALSLPVSFPGKETLIVTTFGVALFTLFVQGLTFEPLVKLLKVGDGSMKTKVNALKEKLKHLQAERSRIKNAFQANKLLKSEYAEQKERLDAQIGETRVLILRLQDENADLGVIEIQQIAKSLIEVQRDHLNTLARKGMVSKTVIESFRRRIDEESQLFSYEETIPPGIANSPAELNDE